MTFIYLAGLILVYFATAQLSPGSSHLARFRRAANWLFDKQLEPTFETKRLVAWLWFVWVVSWIILYAVGNPHGYPDPGREDLLFLYESIALAIMFLVTSIIVVFWLRNLPKWKTYSQACCDRFDWVPTSRP